MYAHVSCFSTKLIMLTFQAPNGRGNNLEGHFRNNWVVEWRPTFASLYLQTKRLKLKIVFSSVTINKLHRTRFGHN